MENSGKYTLLNGRKDKMAKQRQPLEASRGRKALVMAACLYLQCITVGIMFAMAVMYAELIQVFDSSRSQASLIQSIYSGINTGGGIIISPIVKRFGPGPAIVMGAILGAFGFAITFIAKDVFTIIWTVGVIGSFGMSFPYLSSFISVGWIFHGDPGVALVCVTIGSSVGQFVLPYLTEIFIQECNWNGAFLLLSGVALQCIPCGCFMYTSRRYFRTDSSEKELSITESVKNVCDATLILDIAVILILLNSFFLALTGSIEAWYFVDILTSRGYARERGSFLVTMLGFANLIGRIIGSVIRFKVKIMTVFHWIYLWPIISISHILAVTLMDYTGIMGACMLYGVALGTCTAQNQAIMYEVCGLKRAPQGVAMVNFMYGIGNFLCSFLGGVVKDAVGEYDPMFYIAAGLGVYVSLSSACVAWILRRREQREKAESGEEKTTPSIRYKRLQYGSVDCR